jgi:molecular chaperone GrpE
MAKEDVTAAENAEVEAVEENQTEESQSAEQAEISAEHAETLGLLEDARAKADEHWNQLLRANAELENTRRRAKQDVENAHKYALEKFALELLPVKDSLEMGLAAVSAEANESVTQLKEGTELTLKMLAAAMEKFGISEVDPNGEAFDPAVHQAMSMQESADHAPNTVMAVMQKGYQLNDRLIRPAMVVVAKAPAGEMPEAGSQIDEKA